MKKPEVTSKKVASIAGKVLDEFTSDGFGTHGSYKPSEYVFAMNVNGDFFRLPLTVSELKSLAASALTQSPDKPKRKKPARKGRK